VHREGYRLCCRRHIERNPVEAGMVRAPWAADEGVQVNLMEWFSGQ
jgi:hypothetical protein